MDRQKNIPLFEKPVKSIYIWRDNKRRPRKYGLELKILSLYPLADWTLANQIAISGKDEGWIETYNEVTYLWLSEKGDAARESPNI